MDDMQKQIIHADKFTTPFLLEKAEKVVGQVRITDSAEALKT